MVQKKDLERWSIDKRREYLSSSLSFDVAMRQIKVLEFRTENHELVEFIESGMSEFISFEVQMCQISVGLDSS
jgi:hypothetical protein